MKFPGRSSTTLAAGLLLLVLLPGCSSQKGFGEIFTGGKKQTAATVCYSGSEGLEVREAPKPAAKIVGRLKLHQKLLRSEVDGSFVRIRSSRGGVEGWVLASKLLRRLPGSAAAPAAKEAASGPASAGAAAAQGAGADAAAAASDEAASSAEPVSADAAAPSQAPAEEPAAQAAVAPAQPEAQAPAPARKAPSKSRSAASVFDPY